jgi:hypothetical protein
MEKKLFEEGKEAWKRKNYDGLCDLALHWDDA